MKKTEEIENRIKAGEALDNTTVDAGEFLNTLIKEKGMNKSQVSTILGLGTYIYDIINQTKNASRDHIIAILICIKSTNEEMSRVLRAYGYSPLYVRVNRDAIIYKGMYDNKSLDEIEELLLQNGYDTLLKK